MIEDHSIIDAKTLRFFVKTGVSESKNLEKCLRLLEMKVFDFPCTRQVELKEEFCNAKYDG